MQAPIALLLFLITQSSPLSESPYFWSKKYIAFSIIRNCIYKRDMEFTANFVERQFARNYAETVPFDKNSPPEN